MLARCRAGRPFPNMQADAAYSCPRCRIFLSETRMSAGITWSCPRCRGVLAAFPVLRRGLPSAFLEGLQEALVRSDGREMRGGECPICRRAMREVSISSENPVCLDVCPHDRFAWFDGGELPDMIENERRPRRAEHVIPEQLFAFERAARENLREIQGPRPRETWKRIFGYIGVPVLADTGRNLRLPFLTFYALAGMFLFTFGSWLYPSWTGSYGFVSADPWRYGGITLFMSFFLHAGWLHLLANGYFFFVSGRELEHDLPRRDLLALVVLAHLFGNLVAALLFRESIPSVGASGGIAGLLAFHAFVRPHDRVGFHFFSVYLRGFARWFFVPAWAAFLVWLATQVFALVVFGNGPTNYVAHLSGVVVGLLFVLYQRQFGLRGART